MDIDSLYYSAIDLLKQLIAVPSFSRDEALVADLMEDYLKSQELTPHRKGNNVWVLSSDWQAGRPTVLLNSHMDTVKPVSGWQRDPFVPSEEDGVLYGLGSNDAGGPLVSLLQAFRVLDTKPQPVNFIFLASVEEEVSGKNGIESVLPELPPIDLALVGEPTGMQPAIAERGLIVVDGVVTGRSGHAARDEGENAIYKALPVIEWFKNTQLPLRSELLGGVKMSLTMVDAGTQHNVVPDQCRFTVDIRTNECYTNQEVFDYIAANCGCEVTARSLRLNSSGIPIDHPLVQRAVMMGRQAFGSPTLSDQALLSCPSLKMGPGQSSRSHTADEYIVLAEIREAIDLYIRLLNQLVL